MLLQGGKQGFGDLGWALSSIKCLPLKLNALNLLRSITSVIEKDSIPVKKKKSGHVFWNDTEPPIKADDCLVISMQGEY